MEVVRQAPIVHFPLSAPFSASPPLQWARPSTISPNTANQSKMVHGGSRLILCRYDSDSASAPWSSSTPDVATAITPAAPPPVIKRRKRYRKLYPGETKGITEEMRFVAMRLRNVNGKKYTDDEEEEEEDNDTKDSTLGKATSDEDEDEKGDDGDTETWQPSMEGFLKYLVDSEVVFNTVERIVDDSNDVACEFSFR